MRKKIVTGFGALFLVGFLFAIPAVSQPFHFVVLGDNRTPGNWRNAYEQPPAFFDNIRAINLLRPEFAVDVGDLILGVSDTAMVLKEWDYFDEAVSHLQVPLKLVVGNHDVRNSWMAAVFQRRYGPMRYSFDHKGSHFIVLNSEVVGHRDHIVGDQLEWLRQDLQQHADASHIFVFLHKPLWKDRYISNWNKDVHPLLAQYHVDAVFAGHEHHYEDCGVRDGVHYFVTGGGGANLDRSGEAAGGFYHFMWITVDGDSVDYAVVRPEGVKPADVVTSEDYARWEGVLSRPIVAIRFSGKETVGTLKFVNPGSTPLALSLSWSLPVGSTWNIFPRELKVGVPGSDSVSLRLPVQPDTVSVLPLPRYTVKIESQEQPAVTTRQIPALVPDTFVRRWLVIGPFELGDMKGEAPPRGFLREYGPEKKIDLRKALKGLLGKCRWQLVEARENGYVDLLRALHYFDPAVAYAVTYVYAPRGRDLTVGLGSNDGARMWVNEGLVYSRHVGRSASPDQDVVRIHLRKGWNKILLKVENFGGGWGLYLRVPDFSGELRFDPYGPLKH